jgi:hypothetical protein
MDAASVQGPIPLPAGVPALAGHFRLKAGLQRGLSVGLLTTTQLRRTLNYCTQPGWHREAPAARIWKIFQGSGPSPPASLPRRSECLKNHKRREENHRYQRAGPAGAIFGIAQAQKYRSALCHDEPEIPINSVVEIVFYRPKFGPRRRSHLRPRAFPWRRPWSTCVRVGQLRHLIHRTSNRVPSQRRFQRSAWVMVWQGYRPITAYNEHLVTIEVSGIRPAPRGVPRIEVTLEVDPQGIVAVTARDFHFR